MQREHVRSHKSVDEGSWSLEEGRHPPSQQGCEKQHEEGDEVGENLEV